MQISIMLPVIDDNIVPMHDTFDVMKPGEIRLLTELRNSVLISDSSYVGLDSVQLSRDWSETLEQKRR